MQWKKIKRIGKIGLGHYKVGDAQTLHPMTPGSRRPLQHAGTRSIYHKILINKSHDRLYLKDLDL